MEVPSYCAVMQDFRNLHVWRRSHGLVLSVRRVTNRYPRTGYSTLKKQTTDSAESIAYNIVEGCGAPSQKEFARFLGISIKSTGELEYQLQCAKDYGILSEREWRVLSNEVVEIRKMLCGLREKVLQKPDR
jgi:four helix bundle protein